MIFHGNAPQCGALSFCKPASAFGLVILRKRKRGRRIFWGFDVCSTPGLRPAAHLLSLLAKKGGKETSPGYRALLRGVPCVSRGQWRQGKLASLRATQTCPALFPLAAAVLGVSEQGGKQKQQQTKSTVILCKRKRGRRIFWAFDVCSAPGLRPAAHLLSLLAKKGGKETSPGYRAPLCGIPCVPRGQWRQGKLASLRAAQTYPALFPLVAAVLGASEQGEIKSNGNSKGKSSRKQNQPSFCASEAQSQNLSAFPADPATSHGVTGCGSECAQAGNGFGCNYTVADALRTA